MSASLTVSRAGLRAASALSPRLGAAAALPLFMHVGSRLPVRADELATHESARRSRIRFGSKEVAVYEWGAGAKTVLLVHGWRGRAAQFAALVRELRAEGYTVVGFDAPANGDSEGKRTNILDYVDAIGRLEQRYRRFHAIVGHSVGVLAALVAVSEGVQAERVAGIAGVSDSSWLVEGFATPLAIRPATVEALRERFARRIFPRERDVFDRFSAVRHPLPPSVPLLLVHDEADTRVPVSESRRLLVANHGHAELIVTEGFGHTRILRADLTLDVVTAFITAPPPTTESLSPTTARRPVDSAP